MIIEPNVVTYFSAPHYYKEHFIFDGRRYFKTDSMCLVSRYGRYGMTPQIDRGLYEKISTKEFKKVKELYEIQKQKYSDLLNGNLNKGVNEQLTFSF